MIIISKNQVAPLFHQSAPESTYMNTYTTDDTPDLCFNPVPSMPNWTQAMHRATHAERTGQVAQALAHYQMALATAKKWLLGTGSPTPDECLSAFVSSQLCLANLQVNEGHIDIAVNSLAEAHQVLLTLIHQQARSSAWHQAAVWYSRDTHGALVAHMVAHGCHPAIERAFHIGCLTLCTPSVQVE